MRFLGRNKFRTVRLRTRDSPRSRRTGTSRGNACPTNFRDRVNIHEPICARGSKHASRGISIQISVPTIFHRKEIRHLFSREKIAPSCNFRSKRNSVRNRMKVRKISMRIPLSSNDPSRNFDPSLRLMTFGDRLPMTLILHHCRKNYGTKINYRRRFYHPIKIILTLR